MTTEKLQEFAEWLAKRSDISDVRLVLVRLDGDLYEGVEYSQNGYESRRLYLLGIRPRVMEKRSRFGESRVVWRLEGDRTEADWYCAAYYEGDRTEQHPEGPNFIISRWPHESQVHRRIDYYDSEPRERRKFRIEYLS